MAPEKNIYTRADRFDLCSAVGTDPRFRLLRVYHAQPDGVSVHFM